jgi:hypothetical protein
MTIGKIDLIFLEILGPKLVTLPILDKPHFDVNISYELRTKIGSFLFPFHIFTLFIFIFILLIFLLILLDLIITH